MPKTKKMMSRTMDTMVAKLPSRSATSNALLRISLLVHQVIQEKVVIVSNLMQKAIVMGLKSTLDTTSTRNQMHGFERP